MAATHHGSGEGAPQKTQGDDRESVRRGQGGLPHECEEGHRRLRAQRPLRQVPVEHWVIEDALPFILKLYFSKRRASIYSIKGDSSKLNLFTPPDVPMYK